jgi:CRP-like cAMP-binding protein
MDGRLPLATIPSPGRPRAPPRLITPELIMSISCVAAWAVALLLLPILVLLWATESREQRARRWRRQGLTQQAIASRLGCSRSTVRRLLA